MEGWNAERYAAAHGARYKGLAQGVIPVEDRPGVFVVYGPEQGGKQAEEKMRADGLEVLDSGTGNRAFAILVRSTDAERLKKYLPTP